MGILCVKRVSGVPVAGNVDAASEPDLFVTFGMLAARELIQREKVAVLFGGLDTPVSLAIVPLANQMKVPFMGIWAAGTKITENGAADNYVFRVSAR